MQLAGVLHPWHKRSTAKTCVKVYAFLLAHMHVGSLYLELDDLLRQSCIAGLHVSLLSSRNRLEVLQILDGVLKSLQLGLQVLSAQSVGRKLGVARCSHAGWISSLPVASHESGAGQPDFSHD